MMSYDEVEFNTLVKDTISPYPLTPLIIDMINFILKGVCESLILINKAGQVEYMDKFTETYFNLKQGEGKGLHITTLMPETRLHLVANSGVKEIGKIQKVKGEDKIVTRFPIKKNGKIIGALGKIMFHKLEEIENLNREISELKTKIDYFQKGLKDLNSAKYNFEDILGNSDKLLKVKQLAMRASLTEANILIIGESGTGKELIAHSIHNMSQRKNRPFIRVNCAAIPFELAESEFFGYEKGAFSGARNEGKPGKFELCQGGTIFLDEIAALPIGIQSKLLRVLQEKEIERLGGKSSIKVNFRLISAANVSLSTLLAQGRFRSDLFYRLSNLPLEIPPLRERKSDIQLYIHHFMKEINIRLKTSVNDISEEALKILIHYSWPGNVRELINVLEQSVLNVTRGYVIFPEHLPFFLFENNYHGHENNHNLKNILEETEMQVIKKTLNLTKGNKRKAATLLGIQRSVLYQKLKKFDSTLNSVKEIRSDT